MSNTPKFNVGDKIFDLETPHRGTGTIRRIRLDAEDGIYELYVMFSDGVESVRVSHDPFLVPEQILTSPLYQVLK